MKIPTLHLIMGLTIAACLAVWLPLPFPIPFIATIMLLFFLPGWLLLQAIGFTAANRLEQIVLASGISYALTVLGSLGMLYLAGHLSMSGVVGVLSSIALILFLICLRRSTLDLVRDSLTYLDILYFLGPVGVATFFAFTNSGYADYWGDEMNGLLRAISIIAGRPESIFEHTKGPVEILLPAAFGLLVGRFEPFAARFPFGLAYTLGIGGYYLLARQLFGRNIGLAAALILAINGLYLTFGRMVQYQAIVFLMINLSVLLAYRFYRDGQGVYLWLSSLFVGVGLLAHYDALMALPPIGYLVWRRYGREWTAWRGGIPSLLGAAITLVAIGATFYLPFLLNPHISATSKYLGRIISPGNWPANNFDELYVFTVMSNSVYYATCVVLLGLGKVISDLTKLRQAGRWNFKLWTTLGITLGLTLLAVVIGWTSLVPLLVCLLLFTLIIGFLDTPTELKLVNLWVAVPFIVYVFFIDHPRNHLQNIYLGWSLLVALGAHSLVATLESRLTFLPHHWVVRGAVTVFCAALALFAGYQYLLYLDTQGEYVFTYPAHKNSLYWEDPRFPFGSRRLHGAPHRLGWQMINQLFEQKYLQGDWNSNDDGSNLFWYTLGSPRNPCYPRYYFLTQFEQREETQDQTSKLPPSDYVQIGQVWNHDRLQINVYEFAPSNYSGKVTIWSEPPIYTSFVTPNDFLSWPYIETPPNISNPLLNPPNFRPSPIVLQQISDNYGDSRILDVRDKVALLGSDVDDTRAKPGGLVVLTLYWQAVETINLPYKIFTHLEADQAQTASPQLWTQADDFPACGAYPTQGWKVGQVVADRHIVRLPPNIPPGGYILKVGLYEPRTGLRMDLLDPLGNPQGNSFEVRRIMVKP